METIQKEGFVNDEWWADLTEEEFQHMFRMSRSTIIDLQAEIDHCEDVHLNRIDKLLLACVWFLGSTVSFNELGRLFKFDDSKSAIADYLQKILNLGSLYILWPLHDEAMCIVNGFAAKYQFPGVLGVLGSLHIEVNVVAESDPGIYYNNIMEKHTIVLQVVCDNNLLLRDVCVGCPGGKTVKEIFESSPLYSLLTETKGSIITNDLHLLGGTEHPQLHNVLTPYKFEETGGKLTTRQRQFNELHSTVMCTVEKTFKCLEVRFPRLTRVDDLNPEFAALIASSVCILHNFTRVRGDSCHLYTEQY